ncbi:type II toxin-antitoxin system VapB family antitoxin [Brucella anthropi]|nr:type II toxin-antitoxin system VapB family antitoxin [Brucella anthropi]
MKARQAAGRACPLIATGFRWQGGNGNKRIVSSVRTACGALAFLKSVAIPAYALTTALFELRVLASVKNTCALYIIKIHYVQGRMYKMPFNVNDTTVDQLLDQVMKKAGITTKVGAIRAALKSFDTLLNEKTPVRDKFTEIRSKRQSLLGDPVQHFDQKKFMDEMWEDN